MRVPKGTTEFHLEQLKSLRSEIEERSKELRANERYVLIAIAAVWAFMLATVHGKGTSSDQLTLWADALAWLFPVLLVILGWWRSQFMVKAIDDLAAYIRQAEAVYVHPRLPGWETYREQHFRGKPNIGVTAETFWWLLLVATCVVAALAWRYTVLR